MEVTSHESRAGRMEVTSHEPCAGLMTAAKPLGITPHIP